MEQRPAPVEDRPEDGPGGRDELLAALYDELRELAAGCLAREKPGATLQATAIVHDAYLKLVDNRGEIESPAHFKALCAIAIRRMLTDHARRGALLGRHSLTTVTLGDGSVRTELSSDALLDLEDALEELAERYPRQARVVELRFFGGLNGKDAARVIGISPRTADGDWRLARAWLRRKLAAEKG